MLVALDSGGMGSEIDIVGIKKATKIWVEVSVSTNPRCSFKKEVRFKNTVQLMLRDFERKDKKHKLAELLGTNYEMWLVYGKLPLSKDEVSRFPQELESRGIVPVYFGDIFKDMRKLKQYRLDSARGYMNLFESFHDA